MRIYRFRLFAWIVWGEIFLSMFLCLPLFFCTISRLFHTAESLRDVDRQKSSLCESLTATATDTLRRNRLIQQCCCWHTHCYVCAWELHVPKLICPDNAAHHSFGIIPRCFCSSENWKYPNVMATVDVAASVSSFFCLSISTHVSILGIRTASFACLTWRLLYFLSPSWASSSSKVRPTKKNCAYDGVALDVGRSGRRCVHSLFSLTPTPANNLQHIHRSPWNQQNMRRPPTFTLLPSSYFPSFFFFVQFYFVPAHFNCAQCALGYGVDHRPSTYGRLRTKIVTESDYYCVGTTIKKYVENWREIVAREPVTRQQTKRRKKTAYSWTQYV